MIIPKETFFDRFDQSIKLLRKNFIALYIPLFLYNFLYFIVWYFAFLKISSFGISEIWNMEKLDIFTFLNNSTVVMYIAVWIVFFLLYLMLLIPIQLQLIKSIKQWYLWKKITVIENFNYWFKRFFASFSTYYYIFLYVAWIPAWLFIIWWILFNLTYFIEIDDIFKQLSIWIMIFSVALFLIFSIYRWIKTKFSLLSAIDNNEFTKQNFNKSISYTKNNWWRIAWNIFLIWFLISIIKSIISWIISMLGFFNSWIINVIWDDFIQNISKWWYISEIFTPENLNKTLDILWEFNIIYFIWDIIKVWINTLWIVFITIFLYILFKRLENEYFDNEIKEWKIELINENY